MRLRISVDDIEPTFGHWLAGFTDGEGYFGITPARNARSRYACVFELKLRDDDRPILERIRRELAVGYIFGDSNEYKRIAGVNAKDGARLRVTSKHDCLFLVRVFERFPLLSKKCRDFEIWAVATRAWVRGATPAEMARYADELKAARYYDQCAPNDLSVVHQGRLGDA